MSRDDNQWEADTRVAEQLSRLLDLHVNDMGGIVDVAMEVHNLVPPFDWMDWGKGGDAYKNPSELRLFSLEEVARYLTAMIRLDRMSGEFELSQVSDEQALEAIKIAIVRGLNLADY